uniref:Uncharacterized protein n=1 Tax=Kalmanozyma brasiliensis (strain GHG001) TaxID=1365824 RepID=V5EWG2_KALBG
MLAARSLQELINVGGFQAEDDDTAEAGLASLLDSAEALPGGAAELALHDAEVSDVEAASDDEDEDAVGHSQEEERDDASEEDGSDEDEDEDSEEEEDDEDEDEEMDDSAERGRAAPSASRQYHDGFGGVSTRDLLSEGPAGDADEPIVLSDSEDEPEDDDPAGSQGKSEEDDEQVSEEDDPDELAQDSEDESEDDSQRSAEAEQGDITVPTHYQSPSLAQQTLREQGDQDEDMAEDNSAEQAVGMEAQRPDTSHPDVDINTVADFKSDRPGELIQNSISPAAVSALASGLPNGFTSGTITQLPADLEGDGVPDSEVEPEELDDDLRWSDIEADQGDDDEPTDAESLDRLASADAAYRSIQGSQTMPGFVSAAHILADIQATNAEAKIEDPAAANDLPRHDEGPIDPQLLADLDVEAIAGTTSTADDAESAIQVEVQGNSDSQTEADIFDAFTRQDAASELREPLDEGQKDGEDTATASVDADQERDVDAPGEAESIAPVIAFQPVEVAQHDASVAAGDGEEISQPARDGDQPTDMISEEREQPDMSLDAPVQDEVGEVPDGQAIDKVDGAFVSNDEAVAAVETQQVSNASPPHPAQEEDRASTDLEEPAQKPVLMRIESTDVQEADIEDNGEEEAAPEEAIIQIPSASSLAAIAAKADSESEADVAEAGKIVTSVTVADDDTNGPAPPVDNEAASGETEAVHVSIPLEVLVQAQEEEAILSGDLADRDSSIERQAVPAAVESPVADQDDEARVQSDQDLAGEPVEADAELLTEAATETEERAPPSTLDEVVATVTGQESVDEGSQLADNHARDEVPSGESPTSIATAAPTVPEIEVERKDAEETPAAVHPMHLSPVRVPPSPASSDRRSTSSFTPSANRQGNRHLHGTAKRSFFAQVTEVASGFASNLTAPLRAIPSLLPISEKRSEETRESNENADDAAPVENVAQDDVPTESQRQTTRSRKPAEASKFTMNTRSHCICRKLQLTKVEGAPVFIVPGCSIDYQKAQAEAATDLGPTDESLAEEWLTVDPDFLPMDVHHMLSRVIGLQFLNEGICVEPGSSAAEMVFAGWDLDEDLVSSRDEIQKRDPDMEPDLVADEQAPTDALKQKALAHQTEDDADDADPTQTDGAATVEAETLDDDMQSQEPETPSRAMRRSARHRRNSSVASTSSPHRAPHHPDANSPNADYLPDDERRRLLKDRHPATPARGDVSIASLEEQFQADEDTEDVKADGPDFTSGAEQELSSPRAKGKRNRGRKSQATTKQFAQDERGMEPGDAELPLEGPKAKKARGRTSAAPGNVAADEAPVDDPKDVEEAAMVEDALERAVPPPKRPRRGRKTQEAADANGQKQETKTGGEEESDKPQNGSRSTRSVKANEEQASQETDSKPEDEAGSEAKQPQKGRQSGKGGRKRKQSVDQEEPDTATEAATPVGKVAKADDADSVKAQPRRSRRSQGGASAQSPSPSKASPGKASKRKNILKLS